MSTHAPWSYRKLALLTLVCWALATGTLTLLVGSVEPGRATLGGPEDHSSLVARVFGSSRVVLSRHLFLEADRYFHKGIRGKAKRAFSDALLIRWADQIAPVRHEEVSGTTLREIMPWLQMAIGSDPQNFEAWAAAGYWLLQQGEMTAAVALLEEGQRKNPADYRYYVALGQLYFFNHDYLSALAELSRADELWPRFTRESEEEHRLGRGEILTYRAGINESLGLRVAALNEYRELHKMFPNREHLAERIAELEAGGGAEDGVPLIPLEASDAQPHILRYRHSAGHVHHAGCQHR